MVTWRYHSNTLASHNQGGFKHEIWRLLAKIQSLILQNDKLLPSTFATPLQLRILNMYASKVTIMTFLKYIFGMVTALMFSKIKINQNVTVSIVISTVSIL